MNDDDDDDDEVVLRWRPHFTIRRYYVYPCSPFVLPPSEEKEVGPSEEDRTFLCVLNREFSELWIENWFSSNRYVSIFGRGLYGSLPILPLKTSTVSHRNIGRVLINLLTPVVIPFEVVTLLRFLYLVPYPLPPHRSPDKDRKQPGVPSSGLPLGGWYPGR